jgi:hypothetical protein
LDGVFKFDSGVIEAQVIQESIDQLRVRIVPSDSFSEESQQRLERRLHEKLGGPEIHFELCDRIPRGHNGKYRQFVCTLANKNGGTEDIHNSVRS